MSITSVQALERQRLQLLERAQKLEIQIKEAKNQVTKEQAAIIDCLPKRLGVLNLEACAVLIRARIRGEFGPLEAGKEPVKKPAVARRKLTEEQHATMDRLCQEKDEAGKWKHPIDEIAKLVGCAPATVAQRRVSLKKERQTVAPA